jgi:hypothetical protein
MVAAVCVLVVRCCLCFVVRQVHFGMMAAVDGHCARGSCSALQKLPPQIRLLGMGCRQVADRGVNVLYLCANLCEGQLSVYRYDQPCLTAWMTAMILHYTTLLYLSSSSTAASFSLLCDMQRCGPCFFYILHLVIVHDHGPSHFLHLFLPIQLLDER